MNRINVDATSNCTLKVIWPFYHSEGVWERLMFIVAVAIAVRSPSGNARVCGTHKHTRTSYNATKRLQVNRKTGTEKSTHSSYIWLYTNFYEQFQLSDEGWQPYTYSHTYNLTANESLPGRSMSSGVDVIVFSPFIITVPCAADIFV